MSTPPGEYYTQERWQNWLGRIREEEVDPDDEDSARLLLNLQDDAAIAVAKIITDHDDGDLDEETALQELQDIEEIVLTEVELDDEEKAMLLDGVQTSLMCVFYAAQEYVAGGAAEEGTVAEYVQAAADAEAEEDMDAALGYCVQAGTLIIDGEEIDMGIAEELEFGLVAEWVNGLDSLQTAMSDPEVVEEDEEEDGE
ncbi:DUF2150 family protein [Halobacteriales archaeon Cl-PHB]